MSSNEPDSESFMLQRGCCPPKCPVASGENWKPNCANFFFDARRLVGHARVNFDESRAMRLGQFAQTIEQSFGNAVALPI